MRKYFVFILLILPVLIYAQKGKILDDLSLQSKILNSERHYAIYLPSDYETSQRTYPVLYLLHGAGDDQTSWIQHGEAHLIADVAINSGKAAPMIIVLPDANSGQRGYFNSPDGKWRYEDFFFEEFIPFIEKTYRINAQKRYRAIAGLSMGGGGTFVYAMHHPDMFSSACPLSAFIPEDLNDLQKRLERRKIPFTDEQIEKYYLENSPKELLKTVDVELMNKVRWYIDCGDDDTFSEVNALMHVTLKEKEIKHEYRVRDGVHQWKYWREALPNVLEFISKAFRKDRDR